MSEGFTNLIRRVFPSDPKDVGIETWTPEQLASVEKHFNQMDPAKANARDRFEKSALFVLTGQEIIERALNETERKMMIEIMDIANQAYHYNFGLTLTQESKLNKSESYGVAVDTTIGKAFDELLLVEQVRKAQLKEIPIIRLPSKLPVDQGYLFYAFLDPVSKISQAKIEYLDSLQRLFSVDVKDIADARRYVYESTSAYKARISEAFGLKTDDDDMFSAALGMTRVNGEDTVPAVASNNPVLSMSLANSNRRLDSLMKLFDVVDISEEFSASRKPDQSMISLEQIRPQICSVAFNEKAAADHTSKLTPFK